MQVEKYGHMFDDVTYVDAFKQLRLKYDQAPERAGAAGPAAPDSPLAHARSGSGTASPERAGGGGAAGRGAVSGRAHGANSLSGHASTFSARERSHHHHHQIMRRKRRDARDLGQCAYFGEALMQGFGSAVWEARCICAPMGYASGVLLLLESILCMATEGMFGCVVYGVLER